MREAPWMKLGWSPEMLRTELAVKRICIFDFEMALNNTTTLPPRPPEAVREKDERGGPSRRGKRRRCG